MCSLPAGQLACCRWVCWPLTNNRSKRVGKIHTDRSFSVSHYAASSPDSIPPISTETHGTCETVRQTDVVQQRVCAMSAASKGKLWAQSGDRFPRGWHGRWPCGGTSGGEKHWLKQENSHYSSPVQGGHVPLGTDWLSSWSGSASVINSTI